MTSGRRLLVSSSSSKLRAARPSAVRWIGAMAGPPEKATFVERRTTTVSMADGPVVAGGSLAPLRGVVLRTLSGGRAGVLKLLVTMSLSLASGRWVILVTLTRFT